MCRFYTSFGKRAFDILASLIGLFCLLPVFFTIAIAVKVTSKGSIFYVQERLGKDFRPFKMLKFRSMVVNDAQNHSLVTAKQDARITPLGSVLRAYKLDELPQLINVLKGDMSLVGPRPEVERYINHYKSDYEFILKIK
ncbi:MAG: sugar transferase, partial [Candidatus Margulisiibacteriota bacterium]|nr:sugar transferase [Candidatus Margulisiibacteriota bacterium]